jgi:Lrp/AsnC family leucine-responsive transcriptional regulator
MLLHKDVLECHRVTGSDSYLLKVVTENTESLDRLISETLRVVPGVTRTLTTIVMSSVKESTYIKPAGDGQKTPKKR